MLKKYQVFVSSTRDDLVDERKSVSQALLESNCIPAGMELFPASNRTSWEIIKNAIDDSDYYLLIIAGRYGSLLKDENGDNSKCSYTEKEFDYALEIKKPIIAFLYEDIDNLPSKKVERSDIGKKRLEAFREKVKNSKRQVSFWNSTGDLVSKIKTAIQALKETSPEGGWIKEDDSLRLFEASHSEMLAVFDKWKLTKIFKTRAEKNSESDPLLEKHNKAQTVEDRPGDDDTLEPCAAFIHGTTAAGEVHQQQGHRRGDDGGNGGDQKNLVIDILHDFVGLLPYSRGKDRLAEHGGHGRAYEDRV